MQKPRITAKIAGRALHPLLRPFVIGYFFAACACDLVYSQASVFAQNDAGDFASITEWLLGAGLVAAGLTALVAAIDLFGEQWVLPEPYEFPPGNAAGRYRPERLKANWVKPGSLGGVMLEVFEFIGKVDVLG